MLYHNSYSGLQLHQEKAGMAEEKQAEEQNTQKFVSSLRPHRFAN